MSGRERRKAQVVACEQCAMGSVCFPGALRPGELSQLSRVVQRGRTISAGAHLCRAGDPLEGLHVVRSGALKSVQTGAHGTQTVTGFILAGEVSGLDAIANGRHMRDIVALEDVSCCVVPLARLEQLVLDLPGLRQELVRMMSRTLEEMQNRASSLVRHDPRASLAAFLLDVIARSGRRGFATSGIRLSMRWREVASYLGFSFETISRALAELRRCGAVVIQSRYLTSIDTDRLAALSQGDPCAVCRPRRRRSATHT